jgi:hypothetical protein
MLVQALLVASTLTLAAADPGEFRQAGSMKVDGGPERSALLHVGCSADPDGGALVVELIASEANTRKDFDYDDFEGPDAPASKKGLSHVAWKTATGTTDITRAAAGSYLPEPPESFMFGIDQLSRRRGPATTLLAAVGTEPGQLVWTQTAFDDAKHRLTATFTLDASAARQLRDTVSVCLPDKRPAKN